ncbi:YkgJ family cysteine cluster protein [Taibaiella koreensis]|uniref:YkgJ family cysteine cluster protein n=1 Tax=Taibaiella koreensis TaxID=1268548 RepID=UPI000E59C5D6|nr:YkgJ family cysteine cluster protein [Taibaiella koreensis]
MKNDRGTINLDQYSKTAREHAKAYKDFLKRAPRTGTLAQLPALHEEAFSRIDCLSCANCCRNYSPRFKMPDIKRIAKRLRMKESAFIAAYLRMDEDGDYVVTSAPCPFLGADNYCSIYEDRPRDCVRYPYTDEDVLLRQPNLTLKNAESCPAVFHVMERLLQSK